MKSIYRSIALTGALTLAGTQSALATDWSLGVFVGQTTFDEIGDICNDLVLRRNISNIINGNSQRVECNADDSDTALGFNLAYNFTDTWGVELGYVDLGEYTITLSDTATPINTVVDVTAPYLAAVGSYAFAEKFSVSGRLGVFEASGDISTSTIASGEFEGDADTYYGASLDYRVNDAISIGLRYDNFEIDVIGAGLKYHF